jgi:hypothetical protein
MKKRIMKALVVLTGMFLLSASIVWAQLAPVVKTGQTISYRTGDDGDLQKGVPSPDPRFTDNGDGTVTDNLTGLMWAKDINASGAMNWEAAIDYANNLSLGGEGCGSSNTYTDWRLPNRRELESLLDMGNSPAFPSGHPFIFPNYYWDKYIWSSNTNSNGTGDHGWCLQYVGYWCTHEKTHTYAAWPVRSDN